MVASFPLFCNELFNAFNIKFDLPFQVPPRSNCSKLKQVLQRLNKRNNHFSFRKKLTIPISASPVEMMAS